MNQFRIIKNDQTTIAVEWAEIQEMGYRPVLRMTIETVQAQSVLLDTRILPSVDMAARFVLWNIERQSSDFFLVRPPKPIRQRIQDVALEIQAAIGAKPQWTR